MLKKMSDNLILIKAAYLYHEKMFKFILNLVRCRSSKEASANFAPNINAIQVN